MSSQFKLLTVGNPKIAKGTKYGYLTAVLHLAPANLSGYEVCPKATDGCRAACLNTAGRGGIMPGAGTLSYAMVRDGGRNKIQAARIRRTRWYFEDRAGFMEALRQDIHKVIAMAEREGLKPAIRLNGTSDIPWERVPSVRPYVDPFGKPGVHDLPNIMARFPNVQFYDYTKRVNRTGLPSNYHLTFSLAEGNDNDAWVALRNGMNVAAVFHKVPMTFRLPKTRDRDCPRSGASLQTTAGGATLWVGNVAEVPVIDGDEHDLRFLDKRGVVVGLKAKGNAKRDTTGFVR